MKKLNLGSGTECLDDWINIDNSFNARLAKSPRLRYLLFKLNILSKKHYDVDWADHIHKIMIRDVSKKLPFDNESIDYIYSSHLIEHLNKEVGEKLLQECFRVLKKGGLFRLIIPDLELFANNYIKEITDTQSSMDNTDFLMSERFLDQLNMSEKTRIPLIIKILHPEHKWMYDQYSLIALLTSCGFNAIRKMSYKEGDCPDIELLDNRPEESLYLEASK
ncbi:MAG: class I SAM-dependent methyltransferase [Methanosarcinales archaeon]